MFATISFATPKLCKAKEGTPLSKTRRKDLHCRPNTPLPITDIGRRVVDSKHFEHCGYARTINQIAIKRKLCHHRCTAFPNTHQAAWLS